MLDANLIIVSIIFSSLIFVSTKYICEYRKVISENRKEEARYKYLEKKILKELYEQGYREEES